MKKKMLLMLLAVAVSVSMIAAATYAWFTDEDDAGKATFTAGTLIVDVSKGFNQNFDGIATINHMNPGDEFGPITIEIVNNGTKKLAWFGDWQFNYIDVLDRVDGDKLLDVLYIKEARMEMFKLNPEFDEDSDEDPITNPKYIHWSDSLDYNDNFIANGVGSGLYPDWYNGLAALSNYGVITLRNWNDNAGMAPGTVYEHMGALLPDNKYVLTVTLGFVGDNSDQNEYQGDQPGVSPIVVGFKVDAHQINQDALNNAGLGNHYKDLLGYIDAQQESTSEY